MPTRDQLEWGKSRKNCINAADLVTGGSFSAWTVHMPQINDLCLSLITLSLGSPGKVIAVTLVVLYLSYLVETVCSAVKV